MSSHLDWQLPRALLLLGPAVPIVGADVVRSRERVRCVPRLYTVVTSPAIYVNLDSHHGAMVVDEGGREGIGTRVARGGTGSPDIYLSSLLLIVPLADLCSGSPILPPSDGGPPAAAVSIGPGFRSSCQITSRSLHATQPDMAISGGIYVADLCASCD